MMDVHAMKTPRSASKIFYFLMQSVGTFQFGKCTTYFQYAHFIHFIQCVMHVTDDVCQKVWEVHVFEGNARSTLVH